MLQDLTQPQILFCLAYCGEPFPAPQPEDRQTFTELQEGDKNLIIEIKRGIYGEIAYQINPEIFTEKALFEALIKRTWNAQINSNLPGC